MRKLWARIAPYLVPAWRLAVLALLLAVLHGQSEIANYMPYECASSGDIEDSVNRAYRSLSSDVSGVESTVYSVCRR
jgi:hypothetical protein